jgi:hypothetical protein
MFARPISAYWVHSIKKPRAATANPAPSCWLAVSAIRTRSNAVDPKVRKWVRRCIVTTRPWASAAGEFVVPRASLLDPGRNEPIITHKTHHGAIRTRSAREITVLVYVAKPLGPGKTANAGPTFAAVKSH